jgi:hypothetical protein
MLSNSGQKETKQMEITEGSSIRTSVERAEHIPRISKYILESFHPVNHLHAPIDWLALRFEFRREGEGLVKDRRPGFGR